MKMVAEYLGEILTGAAATIVSGFSAWFFAKRKYNAEVDGSVINNMQESLEFYGKVTENNKEMLDDLQKENNELRRENLSLKKKVDDYEMKVLKLEHTNKDLTERVARLEEFISRFPRRDKNGRFTKNTDL